MVRLFRATFAVLLLLVLVGCASIPFLDDTPQERPVLVNMTNARETSQEFELWLGDGPLVHNITVHASTKGDYNFTTGRAASSSVEFYNATSVSFPPGARLYGRYTLEPGGSVELIIEEPFGDTVFMVVIYGNDGARTFDSVGCEGVLYGFRVSARPYGSSGAFQCG